MEALVELDLSNNDKLEIDPRRFKTLQRKLTFLGFSSNKIRSQGTFDAIIGCKGLKRLWLNNTPLMKALVDDESIWGDIRNSLVELDVSNTGLNSKVLGKLIIKFNSLKALDARNNDFSDFTNSFDFGKLSVLEKLNLGNNKLKTVPESIGILSKLSHLDLSFNRLSSLPVSMGNLKALKRFHLAFNALSVVSENIDDLSQLVYLDLSFNKLTGLPEGLGNLEHLQELVLQSNMLTIFPETIVHLKALRTLDLSFNALKVVPEKIDGLHNLVELNLKGNWLRSLPASIGKLSHLELLDLHCNRLRSFPRNASGLLNLEHLRLSNNELVSLPCTIKELLKGKLTYIDIRGNEKFVSFTDETDTLGIVDLTEISGESIICDAEVQRSTTAIKDAFHH